MEAAHEEMQSKLQATEKDRQSTEKKYTIAEREGTKGSSIPTNRVQASSIGEKQ